MKRLLAVVAACVLVLSTAGSLVAAQPLDDPIPSPIREGGVQVRLEPVATGLTAPNWGISAPGDADRLFVVDQDGIVWAVDLSSGAKSVFLDVSTRLVPLGAFGPNTFDERGLLGLAFDPDYANNGLVYTYTSEPVSGSADFSTMPTGTPANHQSSIAEWHVPNPRNPSSVVDPSTRRELLRIDEPQFNHNAGALNFGPDGFLYISLGDGGAADDQGVGHSPQGNGQDPSNVLGSILRIDPAGTNSANGNYGVPQDNPFVGRAGFVPEIWAYGFRNPFRFSFDTGTGKLWTGDVGQNDIEEVDVVTKGGNFGWRVKEGSFLFDPNGAQPGFVTARSPGKPKDLIDPVAEYDHDEGVAVVGGFVYRGDAIPQLRGRYVFGEFSQSSTGFGRLFFLDPADRIREFRLVGQESLGLKLDGFGQDADGELYVLGNTTGTPFGETGVVLRIAPRQRDNELEADLNGFAEVDPVSGDFGAGDLNGDGLAEIRLRPDDGRVCFKVEWADIDEPVAGHIHPGVVGVNGPVVVDLLGNADNFRHRDGAGSANGCAEGVSPALIDDIGNHPGAYYVNIHTAAFPGGAIRGNLERD
ncbi:MAG TPA: PQQ-dependent sugar dehydrogenase [Actinomycetota bacterium]|nr:PQQ-dependent sugar dehydrogenase [Actinomycetota bacterium]